MTIYIGSRSPREGAILVEGSPIVKYRHFLPWAVQKRLKHRIGVWVVDSGGPKEAQVTSYSPGGENVSSWDVTLTPPGEYDWTVYLRRRCGLISTYFDYLLSFLLPFPIKSFRRPEPFCRNINVDRNGTNSMTVACQFWYRKERLRRSDTLSYLCLHYLFNAF